LSKVYQYAVKYNGKYYPPNTPIVEKAAETKKPRAAKSGAKSKPPIAEQVMQNDGE